MTDLPQVVSRAAMYAQDGLWALLACLPCGHGSSHVHINGVDYEICKLLGEGGFSMVYLARDTQTGAMYALKKVRTSSRRLD